MTNTVPEETAFDDALGEALAASFDVYDSFDELFDSLSDDARRVYAVLLNVRVDPSQPIFLLNLKAMGEEVGLSVGSLRAAFAELNLVALRFQNIDGTVQVLGVVVLLSYYEHPETGDPVSVLVAIPDLGVGQVDLPELSA